MQFQWIDFQKRYLNDLIVWQEDRATKCYATEDLAEDIHYYQAHPDYQENENFFCKLVLQNEQLLAVLILLGEDQTLTINPLIVAPSMRGQGYGTAIIKELIENTKKILGSEFLCFEAGIDLKNTRSLQLFKKAGFHLQKIHPDGDFGYFMYEGRFSEC